MRSACIVLALSAVPASAQVRFTELHTYDLAATSDPLGAAYIGSHPVAITWVDAEHVVVAGTNDGTASGVGLVRVRVDGVQPAYGNVFGFIAGTPAGFGYTAVDATSYPVAAYDAGSAHPHGLRAFLPSGFQAWWSVHTRGSSGVVQQTGPAPGPFGVSWLTIGADRRAMHDLNNVPLYSFDDGMVVNPGGSAAWRDLAFDYAVGDYAARRANDVVHVVRTGVNSGTSRVIVDLPDADLPGQNVEFVYFGQPMLLIYNARASTTPGQTMQDSVRIATKTGAPVTIDWGTYTAPTSSGEYDFAYTPDTQLRVAVLDVANRRLSIFAAETLPHPVPFCFGDGTGTACPCGNSGAPGNGCANSSSALGANLGSTGIASRSADSLVLRGSGMTNGAALYFQATNPLGPGSTGVVFGDGLRCLDNNVIRLGVVPNSGGVSQYPNAGDAPISSSLTLYYVNNYQVWYRNPAPFCTSASFNLTNALSVWWGP